MQGVADAGDSMDNYGGPGNPSGGGGTGKSESDTNSRALGSAIYSWALSSHFPPNEYFMVISGT